MRSRSLTPSLVLSALLMCLATGCRPDVEVTTYRLAGNLIPGRPWCLECSEALLLDAVPVHGGERQRFYVSVGRDIGFQFRWGVEQVVEIETWKEDVPSGVVDDNGRRARMKRVVEEKPLAADTRFEMAFAVWPPGTSSIVVEREGDGLRIRDHVSSVLVECPAPLVCTTLLAKRLGEEAFTVDFAHAEGGAIVARGVRP